MDRNVYAEEWGVVGGVPVKRFVLRSGKLRAAVLSYGAALQMLEYDGQDRILGYDTLAGYLGDGSYQGSGGRPVRQPDCRWKIYAERPDLRCGTE